MSHTPGPWRVFRGRTNKSVPRQIRAGDFLVATVEGDFGSGDTEEDAANAALIAAAPELLAALEAYVAKCGSAATSCVVCAPFKAAIAKARVA